MDRVQTRSRHQSADRIFSILDVFTANRPRLTLSAISRRSGHPIATVHRLTSALVQLGVLDRGEDGQYGIGIRLWEIARLEHRTLRLREIALPLLLRLHRSTGSAVLLSVLDDTEAVIIEQISGRTPGEADSNIRVPAWTTTGGLVLLAHRGTPADLNTPLAPVFADIRRTGTAVRDGRARAEFSVAAPVHNTAGTVIAALSVVGMRSGTEPRFVVHAVRDTANDVSEALGAPVTSDRFRTAEDRQFHRAGDSRLPLTDGVAV